MVGHRCYVERSCDMEGRVLNAAMSIYMEQMVVRVACSIEEIGENRQATASRCRPRPEEVPSRIYLPCIEAELGKNNCLNAYQLIPSWVPEWAFISYPDATAWRIQFATRSRYGQDSPLLLRLDFKMGDVKGAHRKK